MAIALGALTFGIAFYFVALRPPLLPEDLRYIGGNPQALSPALRNWLGIVLQTWGAFIGGYGIILMGAGLFVLTGRKSSLVMATALSLPIVFGRFLYSNILLSSDFLWVVAGLATLALATAFLLVMKP